MQFQVSRLTIACLGSISAYSTPAKHDVQITLPISKSMPMNHAKKNSSGYGSSDNQSLTF
jgi:hypothetical protein